MQHKHRRTGGRLQLPIVVANSAGRTILSIPVCVGATPRCRARPLHQTSVADRTLPDPARSILHRGEALGDRRQHEPPVTLCEWHASTQKYSENRAHDTMPDCAAVHPPAALCHGTSPPAAAPAILLAPTIAQLWRLSPAPGGQEGGAGQRHRRLCWIRRPKFFAKSQARKSIS